MNICIPLVICDISYDHEEKKQVEYLYFLLRWLKNCYNIFLQLSQVNHNTAAYQNSSLTQNVPTRDH